MKNEVIVEFKGKSEKGKARIKKHGKKWRVIKESEHDRLFSGPAVTLESVKCKCMECSDFGKGWKWVIGTDQAKDFKLVSVVPVTWVSKVDWFNDEII